MTDIKYDSKKAWAIDYDIYCGYANMTDAQIDYYTAEIKAVLTAGGNFAHVEIDGDGERSSLFGRITILKTLATSTSF